MAVCENCNVDHNEELRKHFPELYLLDKAFETVTKAGVEIFSEAVQQFCYRTVRENVSEFVQGQINNGKPPHEAVEIFAANMMLAGFAIGVSTYHEYADRVPVTYRNFNEQEKYVEEHEAALAQVEQMKANMPGKEQILNALKLAGLIPDDFDGDVEIAQIPLPDAGGDGPPTGMYL